MPLTDKQLEEKLNESLSSLSYDQAIANYSYLTIKTRTPRCTERTLKYAWRGNRLGTLLKKYDSIAFYASRSDFE